MELFNRDNSESDFRFFNLLSTAGIANRQRFLVSYLSANRIHIFGKNS